MQLKCRNLHHKWPHHETRKQRRAVWISLVTFYKKQKIKFCTHRLPVSDQLTAIEFTKLIDVSVSCVCPVIDHEFCHNIVKVAVNPRGDRQVDPRTTWTMLRRNSLWLKYSLSLKRLPSIFSCFKINRVTHNQRQILLFAICCKLHPYIV